MKANHIFAVALLALAVVAMPVQAQSRKDKKAAEKEQWEREQRQKAEEDELRHKMRMDSLRKAQQKEAEIEAEAKEARLRAEEERREAEAAARERLKKQEEAAALQEVEFNEPCADYVPSSDVIFGRGTGEDFEQQMSADIARTSALEELASQLSTKVQALVSRYKKQERKNTKRESIGRIEGLTMTEVDQTTSYRIACRKTMTYIQDGERLFKTYMVIELGEDMLLSNIYKKIQKDDELKVDADYNSFKKEFDDHFKNESQEVLEKSLQEQ